ncbi:collagenase-like [Anticarsia gemmatalis]|uniref:collagenase-like n=1 Tax=Anticarsia gemmatalis TaxID=129554 RepID=UPI003F76EA7B
MAMCRALICLLLFTSVYGVFEDRPTYGYHRKVGVPKAFKLKSLESVRIIGGNPVANADAVPYQAGIITTLTTGWTSICGGSLLSATRVLTAAHCWWDGESQARLFTVVLGSLTIFSGGTRMDTTDVRVHPQWTVQMMNDIAMVGISKVTFSNNIQPIPLPTMADVNLDFVGTSGVISGYGKTSDAQNSFPSTTTLHHTTVKVISNTVCQKSFIIPIHGSHVCIGGERRGTCDGDSGGPLAVVHNNQRIVIGVVSFGPSQGCEAGLPSVFTRTTAYLAWIQSHL